MLRLVINKQQVIKHMVKQQMIMLLVEHNIMECIQGLTIKLVLNKLLEGKMLDSIMVMVLELLVVKDVMRQVYWTLNKLIYFYFHSLFFSFESFSSPSNKFKIHLGYS